MFVKIFARRCMTLRNFRVNVCRRSDSIVVLVRELSSEFERAHGDEVMEEMMKLEEIETGLLTEEPLNRDNAFITAALSFIPRAGGESLFLFLSFFFSFMRFWPQRIHCRRVVGGYRQPVGINVSTRQELGDEWVL